jgi:transposase
MSPIHSLPRDAAPQTMHLSDHSLNQLDEAYVQALDEGALRGLSLPLLEDLKEARERLRQNPHNSSRPPSSCAPWDRPPAAGEEADDEEAPGDAAADATTSPAPPEYPPASAEAPAPSREPVGLATPKVKRKAGKQPGAPGRRTHPGAEGV